MVRIAAMVLLSACAACSGMANAQQYVAPASVTQCRALDGFATDPHTAAWAAVQASHDGFLGNKDTPNCSIKVVDGTGKAKPGVSYVMAGPMTKDECSLYNSLSSIDSKLNQAKAVDANTVADTLVSRVTGLYSTGKLDIAGYNRVLPAVTELRKCTSDLATQP